MNKLFKINRMQVIAALLLGVCLSYGQNQSKKFEESFIVKDSAILEINTSYTDIEFKTWNKNEVLVEATVILEGASLEEANTFFKRDPIEIMGNSKKINVESYCDENIFFTTSHMDMNELHIELPEMPELEHFIVEVPEISEMVELPPLPPLPPMTNFNFDYKAYKKEGDTYLNQWQKDFEKSFNKDYQKKIEAWSKRMETKKEEVEKKKELQHIKREKLEKTREELHEKRRILAEERRGAKHEILQARREAINNMKNRKNTFYISTNGISKNFNIKKVIKITLPKSIKIKMNVRHGEVKLAQTTKNLKAVLSHSNLLGNTIDGNETTITASYSPISVQKWNYGNLNTDYAEFVTINEALYLNLNSTSSDVIIDKIIKSVVINNKFGPVRINYVSKDFEDINVIMQNAELNCPMPDDSCQVFIESKGTEVSCSESLEIVQNSNGTTTYRTNNNVKSDKKITISAKYSDIVLK